MKIKVLVLCICFLSVSSVFAQNWFAGGSFTFDSQSNEMPLPNDRTSIEDRRVINISPVLGYSINRFDFGINPIFQYIQIDRETKPEPTTSDLTSSSFGVGLGLFSRYNFFTFRNFSILGNLGINYVYSWGNNEWPGRSPVQNSENVEHRIGMYLRPEFQYNFSDRILLFTNFGITGLSLSYSHNSNTDQDGREHISSRFQFFMPASFNVGITDFSLGFYILF